MTTRLVEFMLPGLSGRPERKATFLLATISRVEANDEHTTVIVQGQQRTSVLGSYEDTLAKLRMAEMAEWAMDLAGRSKG